MAAPRRAARCTDTSYSFWPVNICQKALQTGPTVETECVLAGAVGLSGGEWSANWQVTRSTKCAYLLGRLRAIGAAPPRPAAPHAAAEAAAGADMGDISAAEPAAGGAAGAEAAAADGVAAGAAFSVAAAAAAGDEAVSSGAPTAASPAAAEGAAEQAPIKARRVSAFCCLLSWWPFDAKPGGWVTRATGATFRHNVIMLCWIGRAHSMHPNLHALARL